MWLCCLKLQQIDYIVLLHLVQFTARFVQETIKYSNSNRVFCTIEGRDNKIQILTVFGWKLSQLCLGYCEHVGEYESKSKSLRQYFCGSSFSVSRLAVFMESLLFAGVINCLTPSSSPRWLLTAPWNNRFIRNICNLHVCINKSHRYRNSDHQNTVLFLPWTGSNIADSWLFSMMLYVHNFP